MHRVLADVSIPLPERQYDQARIQDFLKGGGGGDGHKGGGG